MSQKQPTRQPCTQHAKSSVRIPFFGTLLLLALAAPSFAAEDLGEFIVHHVSDSKSWHLPFLTLDFSSLQFDIAGIHLGVTLHKVMMTLAALLCIALLIPASKRKNDAPQGLFAHAIEFLVDHIRTEVVIPFLGKKDAPAWTPLALTLFFFILFMNFLGLIPFFAAATGNVSVTAALAIIVFLCFNIAGIVRNGAFHYLKNLAPHGVPKIMLVFLYPIEIVSMLAKSMALCIRLFANMTAGHFLIFSLLGLIIVLKSYFVSIGAIPAGLAIYAMELFVAFLQAYIFTLLSMLFIGSAIHQEH